MSKKHFIAIAAEIMALREDLPTADMTDHGLDIVTLRLSAVFAADNPRFDRGRFLRAAGVMS